MTTFLAAVRAWHWLLLRPDVVAYSNRQRQTHGEGKAHAR